MKQDCEVLGHNMFGTLFSKAPTTSFDAGLRVILLGLTKPAPIVLTIRVNSELYHNELIFLHVHVEGVARISVRNGSVLIRIDPTTVQEIRYSFRIGREVDES